MKNKLLLLIFLISASLANEKDYYLIDEYLDINLNQKYLAHSFEKIVKGNAVKSNNTNKSVKIVMVYPGNQISDYWRRSKLSFERRLQELNITYKLTNYFTKPGIEINEQAKQLLQSIKNGTDYLVFTLDAKKHVKFVERIISRSKPKLILQNITTPLKRFRDEQPFLYVGFDHIKGSSLLAEYYINATQGEGEYAVMYGTEGYVSYMRGTKFIEFISKNSNLKLSDEYYTDFNKEKAKKATFEILQNNENIKFIYACSTDIALGVSEALKEKNLTGKVLINGWGGGSDELTAIEKNELDITVMRINDDNGVAMAEAIKLDLAKQTSSVPTIYSGSFKVVKKGIHPIIINKYKDEAFRYSNE